MSTTKPYTAEDMLNDCNGNLEECARVLGMSVMTIRKYRDSNKLSNIIVVNDKVYMLKSKLNMKAKDTRTFDGKQYQRITNKNVSLSAFGDYKMTRENGKVVYWRAL